MSKQKIYHFIGIGGVSMSALAILLQNSGNIVQGSDSHKTFYSKQLKDKGIDVFFGHDKQNLKNCDIVVYTDAISPDNPELVEAKKLNKPILSRAEILQQVASEHKNVIAISGSHGKTTTTGMLAEVFTQAGLNPTVHVGGRLKKFNGNCILGGKDFFITEACEYKNNFLQIKPSIGVILNMSKEHMDFFKTFESVVAAYQQFAKNCKVLVRYEKVKINHDNLILYGAEGYNAREIKQDRHGKCAFTCYFNDKMLFRVRLNLIGRHNIYNALAAISVSKFYNISDKAIVKALENFEGIERRFDIKKEKPFILHDYAHHPSEIEAAISSVRAFRKNRLIVVFQPHTYSRTKSLMASFESAFNHADLVCIVKTYSAREKYLKSGSAKTLYTHLKSKIKEVEYFASFASAHDFIDKSASKKDTVLILGAGNIDKLANKFLTKT